MMTNREWLQSADLDTLVNFLHSIDSFEDSPYIESWDNKYCSQCESIICTYANSDRKIPCSFCELEGYCKFFPDLDHIPDYADMIRLWLAEEHVEKEVVLDEGT